MTERNSDFAKLETHYLFPEINRRKQEFLKANPEASIISLGIGDTTEPITATVVKAMAEAAIRLGTLQGYSGYGPDQGNEELRQRLAERMYRGLISADDIFISDGAKCDIGRWQMLFGKASVAIQDPVYPVYIDGSRMQGVHEFVLLSCLPENNFWPDFKKAKRSDIIYWCSPNNPTGAATTKEQLSELVNFARKNQSILVFDSAYAHYIQDANIPQSIFEIEGAEEVAIEIGSFSKLAGFSGIRLGWSVVSNRLKYADGSSVKADWKRLTSTIFNGASNIAQAGGIAVLTAQGMMETERLIQFYLENTKLLKESLQALGYQVFGGTNAPYLWVKFPGWNSWDAFQEILEKVQLITSPGVGFGPGGEGFLRLSAFGHREAILTAITRFQTQLTT